MKASFNCPRTCAFLQACLFTPIFAAISSVRVFSHVTKLDVVIKDLDALKAACKRLGLDLRAQSTYRWYGRYVGDYAAGMEAMKNELQIRDKNGVFQPMKVEDLGRCDYAIHLNNDAYEIGCIEQPDGTFRLVWDFWQGGRGMQNVAGLDCKNLVGEYTLEVARNAAQSQNWMYEETAEGLTIYHPDNGQIIVHKNGTVDAVGFIGRACDVAQIIENAIGTAKETSFKAEYDVEQAKLKLSDD